MNYFYLDKIENKRLGVLFNNNMDLTKLYGEEYFVKYKDVDYVDTRVRDARKKFVLNYLKLNECFDYGCGPAPLAPNESAGCWDKYSNEYKYFNKTSFLNSKGLMMFDVLEHFIDPMTFLHSLPHKYVFITIPIYPGKFKEFEDILDWKHTKPGEHIWYFTEDGFVEFANECGWDVVYRGYDECPPRSDIGSFVLTR